MSLENVVETDVLVIGGGMAGSFAAIRAKEQGLDVTLVDKGHAGKSGSTPYAFWYAVYNPEWGHNLEEWVDYVNSLGEYLNNREWTEIVFKESYARYQELVSWGVLFLKGKDGEHRPFRFQGIPTDSFQLKRRVFGQVLRKQVIKIGVKVLDRIMMTDLLKQDGGIVGAMGIAMESNDLYIFKARAVVMCSGCSSFKPDGWPVSELTGDGDAMAFRAGAEITGKEFNEPKSSNVYYPAVTMGMGWTKEEMESVTLSDEDLPPHFGPPQVHALKCVNAEGKEIFGRRGANCIELEFEAHAGRAPVSSITPEDPDLTPRVGGAASGMSVHTSEGLWPVNTKCATTIPGLYAAGDSCGNMQVGAVYPGVGYALCGASVTGSRAGLGAAEYASQVEKPYVDEKEIVRLKKVIYGPMERKGGFSPRWVTQVLRNSMIPYFIMYVKHEERMKAALTLVEFMRGHLIPKLTAGDAHELRLAIETKNMVHNAEMKLRASIFRTESRGTHYREDYPRRDDPDWLAWVTLKEEDGEVKLTKRPIPKEWWPDLSRPYEEIYPTRMPGE